MDQLGFSRIVWVVGLALTSVFGTITAAEESPLLPAAHYSGLSLDVAGTQVVGWRASSVRSPEKLNPTYTPSVDREMERRGLTRRSGVPTVVEYAAPSHRFPAIRFDGKSSIWQTSTDWGIQKGGFTLFLTLRPEDAKNGFVFDGSSGAGLIRLQSRDGAWQVSAEPDGIAAVDRSGRESMKVTPARWQVHMLHVAMKDGATTLTHGVSLNQKWEVKTFNVAESAALAGFVLGANAQLKQGLRFDVSELQLFDSPIALDDAEQIAGQMALRCVDAKQVQDDTLRLSDPSQSQALTKVRLRSPGDDGVKSYRIPGLAATTKGTLLAVFDIRHQGSVDLPADIDVGLLRSSDQGATWSKMETILDFDRKVEGSMGNGVGDPTILVDRVKNVIWVAALWSQGNRSWHGSGPGLSPAETGQLVLIKSEDDGLTWSKPIFITNQVKAPKWRLLFQGPGSGIQTAKGDLVFPAQFRDETGMPHATFIVSRDHGENWEIAPAAILAERPTSEAQIAELDDGSLLLTMRDESRSGWRAWSRWTWNTPASANNDLAKPQPIGQWSPAWLTVPDCVCMASLLRYSPGLLLYSSPGSSSDRVALTIRASYDQGKTFSSGRVLDARSCMYSSMSKLSDDSVGIVYEVDGGLTFARFPLDWATPSR